MQEYILGLILSIPALLIALTVHEFAHGFAAYKMGDPTAKSLGRLSLNPLRHFDPIGTICLLLFRFGWAKPVPINPNNFRNHRKGIIIVSLAGPFANFICALAFGFILGAMSYLPYNNVTFFFYSIVQAGVYLNVGLMVFNLIPIPPLDGSKVLFELLPYRLKNRFYDLERYSMYILLAFILMNNRVPFLGILSSYVISFINLIVGLVF